MQQGGSFSTGLDDISFRAHSRRIGRKMKRSRRGVTGAERVYSEVQEFLDVYFYFGTASYKAALLQATGRHEAPQTGSGSRPKNKHFGKRTVPRCGVYSSVSEASVLAESTRAVSRG